LNGTIGIQGQDRAKGALSYATQLLSTSQPIPAPRWIHVERSREHRDPGVRKVFAQVRDI